MRRRSRTVARRVLVLAAALLLAVPAAATFVRKTIHFAASFDIGSAPGGGLQAEVGQITIAAPPTEFVVVPATGGGGLLGVQDGGTTAQATLVGTFKTVYKGQKLDTSWSMSASQTDSAFLVRLCDDSDAGMIDVGFGDDGMIVVDGLPLAPYMAGTGYDFDVRLHQPFIGPAGWDVVISESDGGGPIVSVTGPLPISGQLTVKTVSLIRPSGQGLGQFFVDDLEAVSSAPTLK